MVKTDFFLAVNWSPKGEQNLETSVCLPIYEVNVRFIFSSVFAGLCGYVFR